MKIKLRILTIALILGVALTFPACNGGEQSNTNKDKDSINSQNKDNQEQTFILLPTPEGMFAFTEKGKLVFSAKVMNPIKNSDKYTDTKSKELNFGIYSADLAYAASFNKYQETVKYLKVVREFSDEIGISAVFDESLVKRIDNIIENKDSLKRVTSDTYYDVVKYLEKNKRNRTLALISTGGWLESLYIVTSLIDKFAEDNPTIQLVADHKIIFNNLLQYLEQNKQDESIKNIIADLEPIKAIFDQLEIKKLQPKSNQGGQPNQIKVGGGQKIIITEAQFKSLKEAISKVRNKLTANNV